MIPLRRLGFAGALLAALLLPHGLAAEAPGYSAHAAIALEGVTKKGTIALKGDANFEQRGTTVRMDILSLSIVPGTGAAAPDIVPKGGYSIVYDPLAQSFTVWSAARQAYFTGSAKKSAPSPNASPEPAASPAVTKPSPLEKLKDLRAFSLSVDLAPAKETVAGHVTTAFDFKFLEQGKTGDPFGITGRVNFADDLAGVPIALVANATRGSQTNVGSVRFSLTDVHQTAPPDSDFVPPNGYKKATSIFEVLVLPAGLAPPPDGTGGGS